MSANQTAVLDTDSATPRDGVRGWVASHGLLSYFVLAFAFSWVILVPLALGSWGIIDFAPSVPLLVAGAFVMQFFVQGARGVIPAHINELSPDAVRGFLPGFAYQCGVALAGAIGWLEARFAEHLDYAWAMALTAATVFILGTIVAQLGPERRGVAFGRGAPYP